MALGYTIEEVVERVSDDELAFWRAKFAVEMPPNKADWVRHAGSQSLFANANRDKKKKPDSFKPTDFIPEDI